MIHIHTENIEQWQEATGYNQRELAIGLQVTPGCLSAFKNNMSGYSPSKHMIERLHHFTRMKYEKIFWTDGKFDSRERFGDIYVVDGKIMRLEEYKKYLQSLRWAEESLK